MSGFDSIAEFYEVLSDTESRRHREQPFLAQWLNRAPGTRALDLGCGTGFHSLLLAELGAEVTALDLSPQMVTHAKQRRTHPSINYTVGDMRYPQGGPYDIVFCLGNSLCLVESLDDVKLVMRNVHDVLATEGLFVVQVLNYAVATTQQPQHRIERRASGGNQIVAIKSLLPKGDRTLLSLAFFAEAQGKYKTATDSAVLLHLSREDLQDAAEKSGLSVLEVFGNFGGSPFELENSQDLVMVIKRVN